MFTPSSLFRRRSRDFCSLRDAFSTESRNFQGLGPRDHDDAIHIRNDHIPGIHDRARAVDWNVDMSWCGFYGALCGDRSRPDREVHRREVGNVAHTSLYDKSYHAVRLAGETQQITEHSVCGFRGGCDDENVSRLNELERRVNHDVVAGMARHRDCAARRPGGGIDGPHIGLHQASPALCFVDGRHAVFAKPGYNF